MQLWIVVSVLTRILRSLSYLKTFNMVPYFFTVFIYFFTALGWHLYQKGGEERPVLDPEFYYKVGQNFVGE